MGNLVFLIIFIVLAQPWISILAVDSKVYLIITVQQKKLRFKDDKPIGMEIVRSVKIHRILCY